MSVNYVELAEKLGAKLNTLGEAAFKIGVAGVKLETIGESVALGIITGFTGFIAYKIHKKLGRRDNGWTYDQEGFFAVVEIILVLIGTLTFGALMISIPTLLTALYTPEYLLLKNLVKAVK